MPKYDVVWIEHHHYSMVVDAESKEEACEIAKEKQKYGEGDMADFNGADSNSFKATQLILDEWSQIVME